MLEYESADTDGGTYTWDETAEELHIVLPRLKKSRGNRGCAIAIFLFGLLSMGFLSAIALTVAGSAGRVGPWVFAVGVVGFTLVLLWYLAAGIRSDSATSIAEAPCTITVARGVLKIERAGIDRDLDVSWELSEVADLRLCSTVQRTDVVAYRHVLGAAFFAPDDLVRVSVMLPNEKVEDVVIRAPGRAWIEPLEKRLREHLRLGL